MWLNNIRRTHYNNGYANASLSHVHYVYIARLVYLVYPLESFVLIPDHQLS